MAAETSESLIINANIVKDDELLRYLHILDTLAYESLTAQLKYFEKKIQNQEPSDILYLKRIASKKFMCFFEVKKSLLKSSDFIDINKFDMSNKNEVFNIVLRSNINHFFNLLFTNYDPFVPNLQKVDIESFLNYVVPPTMIQLESIWDLYLNLRVQVYISIINRNPQKNFYRIMFPKAVKGPQMYKDAYMKFRNIIKHFPEDVDKLLREFKWGKFVEEMIKYLSKIINELELPFLYRCTLINASPISSTSSTSSTCTTSSTGTIIIIDDASQIEDKSNTRKRRIADIEEDEDISSDNLDDCSSISKRRNMSHHQ
jgi:hypothetical protein